MPQPERNTTGLADAADRRHNDAVDARTQRDPRLDKTGRRSASKPSRAGRASHASSSTSVPELRGEIEQLALPTVRPPVQSRWRPRSGQAKRH